MCHESIGNGSPRISQSLTWPSKLAERNWNCCVACQRTFCTQAVWSEYVRTIESSSSTLLSNTLTIPLAKLAAKVCELSISEAIAVTELSEPVSTSWAQILNSTHHKETHHKRLTKLCVSVCASQTLITRESPPTNNVPADCFQSQTIPDPWRNWMTSFKALNALTICTGPCSITGSKLRYRRTMPSDDPTTTIPPTSWLMIMTEVILVPRGLPFNHCVRRLRVDQSYTLFCTKPISLREWVFSGTWLYRSHLPPQFVDQMNEKPLKADTRPSVSLPQVYPTDNILFQNQLVSPRYQYKKWWKKLTSSISLLSRFTDRLLVPRMSPQLIVILHTPRFLRLRLLPT